MGCGEFLIKYTLFFANFFFAVAGITLFAVGLAAQLRISAITDLLQNGAEVAPISSMVVGGIVFLIAFFGCCGALREDNCMLVMYSIFMLILMVLKLVLAVMIFVKLDDVISQVPVWMNDAFNRNQAEFVPIQQTFKCCGTTSALVYPNPLSLPPSCCESSAPVCSAVNAYEGCNEVVKTFLNTFGLAIGCVAITVAAVELVAIVFALCLANSARNSRRRGNY